MVLPVAAVLGAAAIGAASQIGSSVFQMGEQRRAALESLDAARDARNWQMYMSNTAFQRQVEDLRAAGLNPMLAVSGTGAATGGAAVGRAEGPTSDPVRGAASAFQQAIFETQRLQNEEKMTDSEVATKEQERFKMQSEMSRNVSESEKMEAEKREADSRVLLNTAQAKGLGPSGENLSKLLQSQALQHTRMSELSSVQQATEHQREWNEHFRSRESAVRADIAESTATTEKAYRNAHPYIQMFRDALGMFGDATKSYRDFQWGRFPGSERHTEETFTYDKKGRLEGRDTYEHRNPRKMVKR